MTINDLTEKQKVLFFDDEPFISGKLAKSLELDDWDVTFVSEINDLFMELRSRQFGILILDIMAPIPEKENKHVNFTNNEIDKMDKGMNTGVILAEKIWREINNDLPIIFLTAKRGDAVSQLPKGSHTYDHIRKPVSIDDLEKKLNDMLPSYTY